MAHHPFSSTSRSLAKCHPHPMPSTPIIEQHASRGTTRVYCEEKSEHRVCLLGRYLLAVARAFMHSFRGKLRVVTSPDITFGAAKFQHQKKFWLRVNRPSGLSPGVLIRPALLQLCALCIGTVRGVPQIVGCAGMARYSATGGLLGGTVPSWL